MKKYLSLAILLLASVTVSASNNTNAEDFDNKMVEIWSLKKAVDCKKVAKDVKDAMLEQGFTEGNASFVADAAQVACEEATN